MKRVVVALFFSLVIGALLYVPAEGQGPAKGKGPFNNDNTVWLVKYHKDQPNDRHGGIAVRMETRLDAGKMKANLKIYRRVNAAGTRYEPALPADIINDLEDTASGEDGNDRRRINFTLAKPGSTIVVKGFFHTARDRSKGKSDRADDVMVIRIIDTSKDRKATDPPCDETPPDEDVLSEDDPLDPPAYP